MALALIKMRKELSEHKTERLKLRAERKKLEKRAGELTEAIDAATEEEVAELTEEVEDVAARLEVVEEDYSAIEKTIKQLEEKIEEATGEETPSDNATVTETGEGETVSNTSGARTRINGHETRAQMRQRINRPEVREFYSKFAKAVREKREITGGELTIPTVVVDMILARAGDYSKLYNEVTVEQLSGNARVIMDGAIPEAIWTECCDEVEELATAFQSAEIDCYKVGGFIPVCNAVLEDSMINLANYVETRLAKSIAKALDRAIISGGETDKMPTGVITMIPAENKVETDGTYADIVSKMGLIDDDEDGEEVEEVIAVMRRLTFYTYIAPQTVVTTSDGRIVAQSTKNPVMPDGTRIVLSRYAPKDTIILGDFKKYLLGERAGVSIESSKHVRFVQDQTVYKGTARYDGEPVYPSMFAQLTIVPNP